MLGYNRVRDNGPGELNGWRTLSSDPGRKFVFAERYKAPDTRRPRAQAKDYFNSDGGREPSEHSGGPGHQSRPGDEASSY